MKYFLFIFAFFSFLSCQDDIQSSSPTFQGLRHGDYIWRSTARTANVQSTGILSISGSDGYGTMVISLPAATVGSYALGQGKPSTILYTEVNTTYSTQNNGQEYPVYQGDGQVTVESIDVENKTMRGTFYFNSYDDSGTKYMNFSEGVFFNLPYTE
mgnify:FL=1|tara:strand:+ start:89 stop:556 length:468 start_codon:yes stop_codon:yes gene_type:complete